MNNIQQGEVSIVQKNENVKVLTMDRYRLRRIADKTIKKSHQVPICQHCGQSSSFVWDFSVVPATKTCRDVSCGVTVVISKKQEAAA